MSRCRVTIYPTRAEFRFHLDGDRGQEFFGCVEDLKRSIPSWARTWEPYNKVWTVDSAHLGTLRDWMTRWFELDEIETRDTRRAHTPPPRPAPAPPADPYAALHLLPSAPAELVRAAYRVMSQLCHPDHGGTHEQMVRINAAWERLQDRAA